jgi:hypothetical protein
VGSDDIDWMVPLVRGVPAASEAQAEQNISFAPVIPPASVGVPVAIAYTNIDTAHQGISWSYKDAGDNPFALTESLPVLTQDQLQALATCHANEAGCDSSPYQLVTLDDGTVALLIDGTKASPGAEAQATSVWWLSDGFQFEVLGPTESFPASRALTIADDMLGTSGASP